jgi:hypothetical protein
VKQRLGIDEKSLIQALDQAHPGLPLTPSHPILEHMIINALAQRHCLLRWMLPQAK